MRPLPEKRQAKRTTESNAGLVFNKFVDQWPTGATEGLDKNKAEWLGSFKGPLPIEDTPAKRIKDLAKANGGKAVSYETTGPFVTGMGLPHGVENGFLWHHTLGCPYLPGSSVKGMVRAWAEHWLGEDRTTITRLFGGDKKTPSVGQLIFYDALPVETLHLYTEIITPHTGDWRITDTPQDSPPADWISPKPIPFLAVKEGAKFQFAISRRSKASESDLDMALGWLKEALEWIGAGAKTAIGFGRFLTQEALDKSKLEEDALQRAFADAQKQALANAPPSVGDRAVHDEWGVVEIKSILGDEATIYSLDEGENTTLPLSELTKQ